jgi:hypothetical protein
MGWIFGCRTLHAFCERCGFFFPVEHATRPGGPGFRDGLDFRVAGWARLWEWVGLSGAALFTVFVKGAGFSSIRNAPRAKKGPSGTDFSLCGFVPAPRRAQAKINRKTHGLESALPATGRRRIEDQKISTLEQTMVRHPKIQNHAKAWPPARYQVYSEEGADKVI